MFHAAYKVGLAALLVGAFFLASNAQVQAQDNQARPVHDEAGYYSEEAEQKANKVLQQIYAKHKKEFYIETVKKSGIEGADAQSKWGKDRMATLKVDGVYLGLSASPRFFRIQADPATMGGLFTQGNINALTELINGKFTPDERLAAVTTFVLRTMDANATKVAAQPKQQLKEVGNPVQQQAPVAPVQNPVRAQNVEEKGMPAWVGWVCMIVGVLLVIWVIFAIIRAMTGMMGGGGYAGGGMGGGGYGGGGGGFLTGMLGGMFGAMAGMWMYNNFFGGHANYSTGDWGGGNNQGGGWGDKQGDFGDKEVDGQGDKGDADAGGGGGAGGCGAGGDAAGGDGDAGGGGGGGDWGDAGGGDAGGGGAGCGGGGGDAGGGGSGCGGAGCGGGGGD